MLTDEEIEAIRKVKGKVGVIEWDGHQLVFARPTRDTVRDYRRKQDSPAEKPDALDQMAQQTIVSFDGNTDPVGCRMAFTAFLDDAPAFTSSSKYGAVMAILAGMVESEDAENLGKGVSVRSGRPKPSPAGLPNGSAPSPRAPS